MLREYVSGQKFALRDGLDLNASLQKSKNLGEYDFEPSPPPDGVPVIMKPRQKLKNVRDEIYEGEWDMKGKKHGRGCMVNKRGMHEGYYK